MLQNSKFKYIIAELFYITHASHILFSAVATTAMFWKHEKKILICI